MRATADLASCFPLEWFGGSADAHTFAKQLVRLVHTWDDLIDKDEPVSQTQINDAFLICLVHFPANPFYRMIQPQIAPMMLPIVAAYEAANGFEQSKDPHGVEIAHTLRFSAGHIVAYAIISCIGYDAARSVLPMMWKMIVNERFDEYRKEHLDE